MARSARTPRASKMMNSENLLILVLVLVLLVLVVMFVRNNQENFRQRKRNHSVLLALQGSFLQKKHTHTVVYVLLASLVAARRCVARNARQANIANIAAQSTV